MHDRFLFSEISFHTYKATFVWLYFNHQNNLLIKNAPLYCRCTQQLNTFIIKVLIFSVRLLLRYAFGFRPETSLKNVRLCTRLLNFYLLVAAPSPPSREISVRVSQAMTDAYLLTRWSPQRFFSVL